MKTLLSCLSTLLMTGCATVSMVSQEAVVETGATETQSEVRKSAEAFETLAETEGWVSENGGLAGLASMLFGDERNAGEKTASTYAERVSASDGKPAAVFGTVATDAEKAARALEDLDRLAGDLLKAGDVRRADLISFESALVTAQKCYRSFSEATGVAEERGRDGLDRAEGALKDLASAIDTARQSADSMADAYSVSGMSDATS